MGRTKGSGGIGGQRRKGGIDRNPAPSGWEWVAMRKRLLGPQGPFFGKPCFFCHHPFASPADAEIQHHVSPRVRPDLAWDVSNMNVAHSGRHRCPECSIACQAVAAGNAAPRDAQGRPVPWTGEFIRVKSAEARAKLARSPGSARKIAKPLRGTGTVARVPVTDTGREW